MPRCDTVIDLCCLIPTSTDLARDANGCIEETVSEFGFVVETITISRNPDQSIANVASSIVDA